MNLHNTYFSLLRIFSGRVGSVLEPKQLLFLFLIGISFVDVKAQAVLDRTVECSCLDNNAPAGLSQFEEELTVTSMPGETWYISSVSGLFQVGSPVPPETPIPFEIGVMGDTLTAVADGTYVLVGVLQENLGYSISLTNGIDTVDLSNILCEYPSSSIEGDNAVCDGEILTYTAENINADYSYEWHITGQGMILGASDEASVEVDWDDNGVGDETISLRTTGPTGCSSLSFLSIDFEEDIILACNNSVNIAVSTDCIIQLGPDDVLEDMQYNNESYIITLTDPITGEEVPLGSLASDVLFDTLEYSVFHICAGNSCWGNVVFEDMYTPPIFCSTDTIICTDDDSPEFLGFPVPESSDITSNANQEYTVVNFDPCGDATLVYEDFVIDNGCATDFLQTVERNWILTDFSGGTSSCTQIINKTRTTVQDIVFPGDWDGVTNPVLDCDGDYPLLPSGYPDPIYTGFPTEGVCNHMTITYTDLVSEVCGATIKVVRKWTVYDECASQFMKNNQILKIEDSEAPVFNCPSDQTFEITDESGCDAVVTVSIPANVVDCSQVSFSAHIVQIDSNGNIAGSITAMNLVGNDFIAVNRVIGLHRITYLAIDECGNESTCDFTVTVVDGVPPTAVCDLSTTIALDNMGSAFVPFTTFDNGSFDNCEIDKIEVSRGVNDCGVYSGFSDHITLCCADANTNVMVTLRVIDKTGLVNTCMVTVTVQDKKMPIINCPASQTISCTDDYSNLAQFGSATASDNCAFDIVESVDYQLNVCGVGSIYRTFTAIDDAGNESSCTQVINVTNYTPFEEGDIIWPADYSTTECVNPELNPDDLPFINSYPQLNVKPCSNVVSDYEDKIFTNANGACKTIFRTWTVIDQCTSNEFSFLQKLYVTDNTAPEFDSCSNKTLEGPSIGDCSFLITYEKLATDECTAQENLVYEYRIDIDNDGSLDITGFSSVLSEELPSGYHKVNWYVIDECNNVEACLEYITIDDKKKPIPYCIGGISTVIMPQGGFIDVWASDLDLASEDNCTDSEDLHFSFSSDIDDTSITFTCDSLDGAAQKIFTLPIYVFDEAGNFDFCTAMIRITANAACDTTNTVTFDLEGKIGTEDESSMNQVELELVNTSDESTIKTSTDASGFYSFVDLPQAVNFELTPTYSDDAINGITTLDIVLIQKHILGLQTFDSPYKVIAADVNGSENVSGADIVQLRKLILGFYDEFPSSPSWRFIASNQVFFDNLAPWPLQESVEFIASESFKVEDFVSVKIGDVNLSRTMGFSDEKPIVRNDRSLQIQYEILKEESGSKVRFLSNDAVDLLGIQMVLDTDTPFAVESVQARALEVDQNMIRQNENLVSLSYSMPIAKSIDGPLFEFNFGHMSPSKITLNQSMMKAEAYIQTATGIEVSQVDLRQKVNATQVTTNKLEVYQNKPNPFTDYTELPFAITESDLVTLEIRDVNGVLMLTKISMFQEGKNKFIVQSSDFANQVKDGILIYTISNSTERVSRKMVNIK